MRVIRLGRGTGGAHQNEDQGGPEAAAEPVPQSNDTCGAHNAQQHRATDVKIKMPHRDNPDGERDCRGEERPVPLGRLLEGIQVSTLPDPGIVVHE